MNQNPSVLNVPSLKLRGTRGGTSEEPFHNPTDEENWDERDPLPVNYWTALEESPFIEDWEANLSTEVDWDVNDSPYETEQEEWEARLPFMPNWENTEVLIVEIGEEILRAFQQGRIINEAVLDDFEGIANDFRNIRILPRDAYPILSELMYEIIKEN